MSTEHDEICGTKWKWKIMESGIFVEFYIQFCEKKKPWRALVDGTGTRFIWEHKFITLTFFSRQTVQVFIWINCFQAWRHFSFYS